MFFLPLRYEDRTDGSLEDRMRQQTEMAIRDADVILGDNGTIYRLVNATGAISSPSQAG